MMGCSLDLVYIEFILIKKLFLQFKLNLLILKYNLMEKTFSSSTFQHSKTYKK